MMIDNPSPIRVGIIGAGFWAVQFYLPYLSQRSDIQCVGIVRRGERSLAVLKDRFGLEIATEDPDALLAAGCDGIIVASPHALHYQHAAQALSVGAHVLVEKPMCLTLQEALGLRHDVEQTGRHLTVAYGYNFLPIAEWAIDFVQQGNIGQPLGVTGYMSSSLLGLFSGESAYGTIDIGSVTFEAERSTWADSANRGGYLYGQLSHLVGLAMAFCSSPPVRVFSYTQRLPNGADIDASIIVELADGGTATLAGNGRLPLGARVPMELRVTGEDGSLLLDFEHERAEAFLGKAVFPETFDWEGELAMAGRPADSSWPSKPGDGVYSCEGPVEYLLSCCAAGPERVNRASIDLGVRAVAILDAAYRSAATGEPVRPYDGGTGSSLGIE